VFALPFHVDRRLLIAMAGRLSSRLTNKIRKLRRLLRGSTKHYLWRRGGGTVKGS
jgi:hypothetical protein